MRRPNFNRRDRVEFPRRIELRAQPPDHAAPLGIFRGCAGNRSQHDRTAQHRLRPIGPWIAGHVNCDHLERAALLVDRDQSGVELFAQLDLEAHCSAERALLVMRKDPFDERMPGRKEINELVLDRLFAIERADITRSAGHAR